MFSDGTNKINDHISAAFKKNYLDILHKAREQVLKLGQIQLYREMLYGEHYGIDEDEEMAKQIISDTIDDLRIMTQYYLEKTGLMLMLEQFNSEFKQIGKVKSYLDYDPIFDYHNSPYLDLLSRYLSAITSDLVLENENEYETTSKRQLLEQILQGTGKLIYDKSIIPSNEADVRREIYNLMIHVFPDTVREIPFSRPVKTFKADIGVRSLKTAIEYKFATNLEEVKTILGGIFEDMTAYDGSDDWKYFYAVFYMNDNYISPGQLQAEWNMANITLANWKPILAIGKGERSEAKKSKNQQNAL